MLQSCPTTRIFDFYILIPLEGPEKERWHLRNFNACLPLTIHAQYDFFFLIVVVGGGFLQPLFNSMHPNLVELVNSALFLDNFCYKLQHNFLSFIKSFRNMGWVLKQRAGDVFYILLGSYFWLAPVLTCICPWCFGSKLQGHTAKGSVEAVGLPGLHKRLKILLFSCQVLHLIQRQAGENSLSLCAEFPTLDSSWRKQCWLHV